MRILERGEDGINLISQPLDNYISDLNRNRGGWNSNQTVYRQYFAAASVYLNDGSIIPHIYRFKEMLAGTFQAGKAKSFR